MRARPIIGLVGLTLCALSSAALAQSGPPQPAGTAQQPIGKIESASGSVKVKHSQAVVVQANAPNGGVDQAKVGDFVYQGDLVETGVNSAVGMVFTDGTAFNLSANAKIELNEFVYDPNGKSNSAFVNLTKGTFTFIAGKVAQSGNMKVDTPVATMGIRGTAPHVEISEDGTVHFATLVEDPSAVSSQQKGQPSTPGHQRAAPAPQNKSGTPGERQAKAVSSQGTEQAMAEQNKKLKSLNICRGC